MLEVLGLVLFFLVMAVGVLVIVFGLPGCWIILADALVYALLTDLEKITWVVLAALLLMALAGEGVELLVNVYGAKRYGASRRAIIGAIGGAILGAVLMSPLLFLVGAVLGAFVGAFTGAFLVEFLSERNAGRALRSGWGAFLGKMGGMLAKGGAAVAMSAVIIARIF